MDVFACTYLHVCTHKCTHIKCSCHWFILWWDVLKHLCFFLNSIHKDVLKIAMWAAPSDFKQVLTFCWSRWCLWYIVYCYYFKWPTVSHHFHIYTESCFLEAKIRKKFLVENFQAFLKNFRMPLSWNSTEFLNLPTVCAARNVLWSNRFASL